MASKKKKKKTGTFNLRIIAVVLSVALILLFALYRYFMTPEGRIFLLDMGLDDRYERVQRDLESEIYQALLDSGIQRADIEFESAGGGRGRKPMFIQALAPPGVPLVKINASIDRAVEEMGGSIRSCREKADGRGLTIKIGTSRVKTHTVIINRSEKAGQKKDERNMPCVAIIVDDFGFFNNSLVKEFIALDAPVAISVIPGLRHSGSICRSALDSGKEVICHLPMEPRRGADDVGDIPLIRVDMDSGEIGEAVRDALKTTPGVVGMNNHMGSLATADRRVMKAVLEVCVERGLLFVDSKTTNRSVVEEVGGKMGAEVLSNDIFLDNRDENTRDNMRKLLSIAIRRGEVLGIMHVRKDSLEHLKWMISEAKREGVRIISITELVEEEKLALWQGGK